MLLSYIVLLFYYLIDIFNSNNIVQVFDAEDLFPLLGSVCGFGFFFHQISFETFENKILWKFKTEPQRMCVYQFKKENNNPNLTPKLAALRFHTRSII